MLTKIWTGFWLVLLAASLVALVVAFANEKNFHPLRDCLARFRRLPFGKQLAVLVFVCTMWAYASIKPGDGGGNGGGGGDGGTNNVPQMVPGPGVGNLQPMNLPGGGVSLTGFTGLTGFVGEGNLVNPVNPVQDPITSTNTTHTIEAADFERGFVMTRIGTDEEFDFTPPPNVTIVNDWRAFGAATDWIYANVKCKV